MRVSAWASTSPSPSSDWPSSTTPTPSGSPRPAARKGATSSCSRQPRSAWSGARALPPTRWPSSDLDREGPVSTSGRALDAVGAGLIPRERVPLAPRCTLGVGGPAQHFVEAPDEDTVREALAWARHRGQDFRVLGGGSNLVVADEGVSGLVAAVAVRGIDVRETPSAVEVTAGAGEPWDDLVRLAVERGWAGLECLSGIPGLVGATPIQNVGAYGQEVSETVAAVRALDTRDGAIADLSPADCRFAYRDSVFKSGEPGRWVVLAVRYRLRPGAAPTIRYAEV